MIKESIQLSKMPTHHIGARTYIKQILMDTKGEVNSDMVTVGEFNTPLTSMGWSSRQKINKETVTLNDTLEVMDLRLKTYQVITLITMV